MGSSPWSFAPPPLNLSDMASAKKLPERKADSIEGPTMTVGEKNLNLFTQNVSPLSTAFPRVGRKEERRERGREETSEIVRYRHDHARPDQTKLLDNAMSEQYITCTGRCWREPVSAHSHARRTVHEKWSGVSVHGNSRSPQLRHDRTGQDRTAKGRTGQHRNTRKRRSQ